MSKYINLIGKRFNRLVVLEQLKVSSKRGIKWKCICDCGNITDVFSASLNNSHVKSCGCLQKEFASNLNKLDNNLAAKHTLLRNYKRWAQERNLEWNLTESEFINITLGLCFYCGALPAQHTTTLGGTFVHNGIDRVDNTKGYTLDNIVPCCKYCNFAKHDLTKEDFIQRCMNVAKKHLGAML